jgi:phage gp29-like protein
MIEESNSIEETRDKLFSMHEKMDSSEVSDLLARAIFISEVWGRINNDE